MTGADDTTGRSLIIKGLVKVDPTPSWIQSRFADTGIFREGVERVAFFYTRAGTLLVKVVMIDGFAAQQVLRSKGSLSRSQDGWEGTTKVWIFEDRPVSQRGYQTRRSTQHRDVRQTNTTNSLQAPMQPMHQNAQISMRSPNPQFLAQDASVHIMQPTFQYQEGRQSWTQAPQRHQEPNNPYVAEFPQLSQLPIPQPPQSQVPLPQLYQPMALSSPIPTHYLNR